MKTEARETRISIQSRELKKKLRSLSIAEKVSMTKMLMLLIEDWTERERVIAQMAKRRGIPKEEMRDILRKAAKEWRENQ